MMNDAAFFSALRRRNSGVFGASLSQGQVDGLNRLLAAGKGLPVSWLAYALATAYHEVGSGMQPKSENMDYSAEGISKTFGAHRLQGHSPASLARNPEKLANVVYGGPWGAENLGNTQPGDGWKFRGRNYSQMTGRRNYGRIGQMIGVDLVGNPDLANTPDFAGDVLFAAMEAGVYTGHGFKDHLPNGPANLQQFVQARRIINGTDKADRIAGYAMAFQDALVEAGYRAAKAPAPITLPPLASTEQAAPAPAQGFWAWLLALLKGGK
ncbi:MAG: hypothetical protein VKL39_07065 [Leptolyngbyaceae bacterium]|nr:hypothetical protein [Leptolyngbyaceae bacterium]